MTTFYIKKMKNITLNDRFEPFDRNNTCLCNTLLEFKTSLQNKGVFRKGRF